MPFLLAVLYPMIDIMLALLVVGQVVLRVRRGIERSAVLCLGFVLFAIADLNFVDHLSQGTYGFNVLDGLLWAARLRADHPGRLLVAHRGAQGVAPAGRTWPDGRRRVDRHRGAGGPPARPGSAST